MVFGGSSQQYSNPTVMKGAGVTPGHARAEVSPLLLMPKAIKTGELCKMGLKVKNWKRRYCIMTSDCLYYFTNPSATQQKGEVLFGDVSSVHVDDNAKTKKTNVFVLESERRNFFFQADSESEMNEWITILSQYIAGREL